MSLSARKKTRHAREDVAAVVEAVIVEAHLLRPIWPQPYLPGFEDTKEPAPGHPQRHGHQGPVGAEIDNVWQLL